MTTVEIRVRGRLDEDWSEWFEGLTIVHTETNESILSGMLADQTAVYSLLARLRDLGLELLSVQHGDETLADH